MFLSCFTNKLIDANVALALDMREQNDSVQVKVSIEAFPRIEKTSLLFVCSYLWQQHLNTDCYK